MSDRLRELLTSQEMTGISVYDREWLETLFEFLTSMSDDYLVETLRSTLMVCAARLAGLQTAEYTPSVESVQHGLKEVVELFQESVE